jgi:hypothetical protein
MLGICEFSFGKEVGDHTVRDFANVAELNRISDNEVAVASFIGASNVGDRLIIVS